MLPLGGASTASAQASALRVPRGVLSSPLALTTLVAVWVLAVYGGLSALVRYENQPGVPATPPVRWPAASRIERATDRATLVMLVHPHCPCSRASIEELDRLMASASGRVSAHVLFLKPDAVPEEWEKTDLWSTAAAIPGVHVHVDDAGDEAGLFHAATSGQVVLYDANGELVFSGGITDSRGHAGDNAGRDAILAALRGKGRGSAARTPVFGCSLHEPAPGRENDAF